MPQPSDKLWKAFRDHQHKDTQTCDVTCEGCDVFENLIEDVQSFHDELVHLQPIRDDVKDFAVSMEIVLQQNDHKGGWHNCTLESLMIRIDEELQEVKDELAKTPRDWLAIQKELVDVANFCMMVHDVAGGMCADEIVDKFMEEYEAKENGL